MFSTKSVKLDKDLVARVKRYSEIAGYSSVEEFISHALEKELSKLDGAASEEEIKKMSKWVLEHLGADVPMHFTRFHPTYRVKNLPRTPVRTLERCRDIAMDAGGPKNLHVPLTRAKLEQLTRPIVERIRLTLTTVHTEFDPGVSPDTSDDTWQYRVGVDLQVIVDSDEYDEPLILLANADQDFEFAVDPDETGPEGEDLWEIASWHDLEDGSRQRVQNRSWGNTKYFFYQVDE